MRPLTHYNLLCNIMSLQFYITNYCIYIIPDTQYKICYFRKKKTYLFQNHLPCWKCEYINHIFTFRLLDDILLFYNSALWTSIVYYYNFNSTTFHVFNYNCNLRNHNLPAKHFNIFFYIFEKLSIIISTLYTVWKTITIHNLIW